MKFDISGFFGHVKPWTKVIKILFNSSICVPCSLWWSMPMRRQKRMRMMKMTKTKKKKRTSSFLFVVSPLAQPENDKNQDSSLFRVFFECFHFHLITIHHHWVAGHRGWWWEWEVRSSIRLRLFVLLVISVPQTHLSLQNVPNWFIFHLWHWWGGDRRDILSINLDKVNIHWEVRNLYLIKRNADFLDHLCIKGKCLSFDFPFFAGMFNYFLLKLGESKSRIRS